MLTLRGAASQNFFVDKWSVIPARFIHYAAFQRANPEITSPLYLTLFTAMFLHGGWLHIGGNMLFLWVFGDNVEDAMGPVRFLIYYLLCGLAGNFAHIYFNQTSLAPSHRRERRDCRGARRVYHPASRAGGCAMSSGLASSSFRSSFPHGSSSATGSRFRHSMASLTLGANFRSGGASGERRRVLGAYRRLHRGRLLIKVFTVGRHGSLATATAQYHDDGNGRGGSGLRPAASLKALMRPGPPSSR